MADLIIKPATGTGNKLILQDKAGGAVLTTADSGATVTNATLTGATLDNATQDSITRLGTVTTGTMKNTIHNDATFPKGISRGVCYLLRLQTSGNSNGGNLGGTGEQQVPFDTIKNGTEDSAFTQNILSLSSNFWTMNTGYYIWDYTRPSYRTNHSWVTGLKTYGASDGSGSSWGNTTTDNVNFGDFFYYTHDSAPHAIPNISNGCLKVTSTSQKYGFLQKVEINNAHGTSARSQSAVTQLVQAMIRFIKIGDI